MIRQFFLTCCFLTAWSSAQVVSKTAIDFCSVEKQDCGRGICESHRLGNRCKCPRGWMGRGCSRPCQDVYRSCARWKEERRCSWTRPISPFFADNCALSCGSCEGNGKRLPLTLPPILDNIAWLVGRWETRTNAGDRFPEPIDGAYREILEVQISDVPSFDRPPVNISTLAISINGDDIHRELGFMTSKPFNEDTGFIDENKPKLGEDKVAIETVGNTGMMIIEEGIIRDKSIKLETTYKKSILGSHMEFQNSRRMFLLIQPDLLEERVIMTDSRGQTRKWLKRYRRTFDYLHNIVSVDDVDLRLP
ncbi:unnamed protein product [Auanema sp. JU1783]|nr:unnamed protein product [Auanema sp. JU1783]